MPTRIPVTAIQPLTYRGRAITVGESFEMKPIEALAAHYQGKVRLVPHGRTVQTRALTAEADAVGPDAPTPKRRYRRRDMAPEA